MCNPRAGFAAKLNPVSRQIALTGLTVLLVLLSVLASTKPAAAEASQDAILSDTILTVSPEGLLRFHGQTYRCSLGRTGVRRDKREGDGATPVGDFPLRQVYYRPDRLAAPPACALPLIALQPDDGWCDDPASPFYNQPVKLPFAASHENLWREDGLYDLVVVIGFNDNPPLAGRGSAIFLHVARPDYAPTAGCVALALPDLLRILEKLKPGTRMVIEDKAAP